MQMRKFRINDVKTCSNGNSIIIDDHFTDKICNAIIGEPLYRVTLHPIGEQIILPEKDIIYHDGNFTKYKKNIYGVGYEGVTFGYNNIVHNIWQDMITRCYSKTNVIYPEFGGSGITVCEFWHCYEYFIRSFDSIIGSDIINSYNSRKYVISMRSKEKEYNLNTARIRYYNGSDVNKAMKKHEQITYEQEIINIARNIDMLNILYRNPKDYEYQQAIINCKDKFNPGDLSQATRIWPLNAPIQPNTSIIPTGKKIMCKIID